MNVRLLPSFDLISRMTRFFEKLYCFEEPLGGFVPRVASCLRS